MYKTEDKDYTGCHPVIAEHLKQGKNIWCKCWIANKARAESIFVVAYYKGCEDPYVAKCGTVFTHAEPIEVKRMKIDSLILKGIDFMINSCIWAKQLCLIDLSYDECEFLDCLDSKIGEKELPSQEEQERLESIYERIYERIIL